MLGSFNLASSSAFAPWSPISFSPKISVVSWEPGKALASVFAPWSPISFPLKSSVLIFE